MKTITAFLFLFLFAGCCKEYCDGSELLVSFENFRARQTDTVYFVSYVPKTGRTQVVDSFRVLSQVLPTDTSRSSVVQSLSSAYDWKVTLPSASKQYLFENFDLTTEKCNCGGKKYKSIRSFSVNGARKEGLFIALN
ncbi:MAG TPA: hypothetical protein VFL47_07345 [Flavisolibacter sp.]|nr:hypothetical protein [Flavisolibacter sp.]